MNWLFFENKFEALQVLWIWWPLGNDDNWRQDMEVAKVCARLLAGMSVALGLTATTLAADEIKMGGVVSFQRRPGPVGR